MELIVVLALVALVGALVAAFSVDSRPGFGDNREAMNNSEDR